MKQKSGLKLTRNRSILIVLYAIYISFILVSAVPYIAENMGQRGQQVGDNYEYHVVLESDGDDVAHYFNVDLFDDAQVGTIDLEYFPASHTLNVDVTNIQKLTMDCESFYEDEAEFLLGETYTDDTDYYKEWFIAGGDNKIDPFTVNVDTDTAMTFVKFDGVPDPYEVFVDPVEEDRQEWWQSETNYDKTGDSVTVTNVPVGTTLVEIYFQAPDNNPPEAIFTPTPSTQFVDASVSFDGSGSSDPDSDPLTYSWDFDDGSSLGTGETTTHTYTAKGDYAVELTVSDGKGGVDTHTETVKVIEEGEGDPPVASWTMPSSAQIGKEVTFNAGGSSDPDGSISSYSWDFDNDGTEDATGVTAKHTYTDAGTYTVKLTVTDNDGLTNTVTDTITISTEPVVDDDDDDDDEGMLGLGKVAGIDLLWIILIIVIVVILIIVIAAGAGKKKKKAEAEAAAAAAVAQAPPEAAGPPGAEIPPEQPPMYEQPPPPMYEEQPMAPPPMEEPMAPPMEEPMMPEGEAMPPVEEPPVEEPPVPDEGETLPEPEETTGELPEEELPEEELAAEEEIPAEPTEGEAPAEEPAAEEQPPAEEGGAEAEMTSCPACNAPIPVGAPVCPSCNSEFEW